MSLCRWYFGFGFVFLILNFHLIYCNKFGGECVSNVDDNDEMKWAFVLFKLKCLELAFV